MEGDSGEAGGGCESVEALSDRVGMRRVAVLTGEDVVAGVVVAADALAFAVLDIPPSA